MTQGNGTAIAGIWIGVAIVFAIAGAGAGAGIIATLAGFFVTLAVMPTPPQT